MDDTDFREIAPRMEYIVASLEEDFVGVSHDGYVIALGRECEIAGSEQTWRGLLPIAADR